MYTKNTDDPGYELNTHLADAPSVLIDYQPLLPTHDKAFSSIYSGGFGAISMGSSST